MRTKTLIAPALAVVIAAACTQEGPTEVESPTTTVGPVAQLAVGQGTHAYPLTPLVGEGTGQVNLTPEASKEGLSVQLQVSVRWTEPNAEFLLTRSVDFVPDGDCTGTTFVPLPAPNLGPPELLRTSPAGAGAKHASFFFEQSPPPPFADGQQFDVHWEIRSVSGSTVLRSPCITVTVR